MFVHEMLRSVPSTRLVDGANLCLAPKVLDAHA